MEKTDVGLFNYNSPCYIRVIEGGGEVHSHKYSSPHTTASPVKCGAPYESSPNTTKTCSLQAQTPSLRSVSTVLSFNIRPSRAEQISFSSVSEMNTNIRNSIRNAIPIAASNLGTALPVAARNLGKGYEALALYERVHSYLNRMDPYLLPYLA